MKTVIITGGAQGIGLALVKGFSQKGYQVISLDISKPSYRGENIDFYQVDLSDKLAVKTFFSEIGQKYKGIDILINNAARAASRTPLTDIDLNDFQKVIDTNLMGAVTCCKYFLQLNKGRDYGRIINLASTRFNQNEENFEAYGSSKGAIVSLTNSLCVSLRHSPVTVNAIAPGWIQNTDYDQLLAEDHSQHPSNRVGKPKDILNLCLFLCEEENDFINGATIVVDGGMSKRMIYFGDDSLV